MKIFRFGQKVFFIGLTILSKFINANSLSCISMKNQECKTRPEVINVNSNNPVFYPFNIKISKCSGNWNNINNSHGRICVPDIIKNVNVKVFNLMSRTNETRFKEWHEKCKCKCRLNEIVCNYKQRWNKSKCRCECKELIDKGVCDKEFIWNPSNCECECDKTCGIGEYLDYENCKYRKKLVNRLIDESTESIEEMKLAKITLEKENENKYSSCTMYIVLIIVFFKSFTGISIYFVYCNWSLIKYNVYCIKFSTHKETKIW